MIASRFTYLSLYGLLVYQALAQNYDDYYYGTILVTNLNTSEILSEYRFAKAYFGPQLPTDQDNYFAGILHKSEPKDGCQRLQPPPYQAGVVWIAVIKRSNPHPASKSCHFIDKVYNAQLSGYSAVIIYDYDEGADNVVPMDSNNVTLEKRVSIPSVFVNNAAGVDMAERSFPDVQYVMTEAKLRPNVEDYLDPYKVLIPMAFAFMGILLVAVIVMIVRWCQVLRRRRRSRISKSQLKKLPLVKYQEGDQCDCCAICLDDYEVGEKVRLLPCSHTYHQKCIDPWLLKNKRTCPVCKRRVVPKSPRRRNDTENADSSDSDDAEEGNEQQPLLRPPVGRRRSSGGRRSNDDESSSYGATGYQRTLNDNLTDEDEEGSRHPAFISALPPHRNSSRREERVSDASIEDLDDSNDDGIDLRNPAAFLSTRHEPTSTFAGAHSLKSLPGGPGPDQPLIPPLPQVHRQHVQASDDSSANQPPDVGSTSCDRIQAAENDSPDETGIGSGSHDHVDVVSSLIAVNGGEGTTQSVIV